jgi:hypothetical protein
VTALKKIAIGCAGLVAAPLILIAAAVAPLYRRWVERRARQGRWGPRRDLSRIGSDLWFSWMSTSEAEARAALGDAVDVLVSLLPRALGIDGVESLTVENSETGAFVTPSRIDGPPIVTEFGRNAASMLHGESAEEAFLIVNAEHRLRLDLDARSFVAGNLSVELPIALSDAELAAARAAFGARQTARLTRSSGGSAGVARP